MLLFTQCLKYAVYNRSRALWRAFRVATVMKKQDKVQSFYRGNIMGGFSIWHWLIVLIVFVVAIFLIVKSRPPGPNRFGEMPSSMSFGEAIWSFFKNYARFSGRASRSEFWYSMLFVVAVLVTLNIGDPSELLGALFFCAVFLPTIAVSARRLHDTNRSGRLQILSLLGPIGTIAVIVWYCTKASDQSPVFTHAASTHPPSSQSV